MKDNLINFKDKVPIPSVAAGLSAGVKMIEGDDRLREQKCLQEIQGLLDMYDCNMVPEMIISGPNIMTRVSIVAKKRVAPVPGNDKQGK